MLPSWIASNVVEVLEVEQLYWRCYEGASESAADLPLNDAVVRAFGQRAGRPPLVTWSAASGRRRRLWLFSVNRPMKTMTDESIPGLIGEKFCSWLVSRQLNSLAFQNPEAASGHRATRKSMMNIRSFRYLRAH